MGFLVLRKSRTAHKNQKWVALNWTDGAKWTGNIVSNLLLLPTSRYPCKTSFIRHCHIFSKKRKELQAHSRSYKLHRYEAIYGPPMNFARVSSDFELKFPTWAFGIGVGGLGRKSRKSKSIKGASSSIPDFFPHGEFLPRLFPSSLQCFPFSLM